MASHSMFSVPKFMRPNTARPFWSCWHAPAKATVLPRIGDDATYTTRSAFGTPVDACDAGTVKSPPHVLVDDARRLPCTGSTAMKRCSFATAAGRMLSRRIARFASVSTWASLVHATVSPSCRYDGAVPDALAQKAPASVRSSNEKTMRIGCACCAWKRRPPCVCTDGAYACTAAPLRCSSRACSRWMSGSSWRQVGAVAPASAACAR
mmetsp:Transcript_18813/g.58374  ORF Transcript_18813/g.58374 Transcript_18813/m.58374 type:complete len:208 (-) Transcript_18813:84-707(-)